MTEATPTVAPEPTTPTSKKPLWIAFGIGAALVLVTLFGCIVLAGLGWFVYSSSNPKLPLYPNRIRTSITQMYKQQSRPYVYRMTFSSDDKPAKIEKFYNDTLVEAGWEYDQEGDTIFGDHYIVYRKTQPNGVTEAVLLTLQAPMTYELTSTSNVIIELGNYQEMDKAGMLDSSDLPPMPHFR